MEIEREQGSYVNIRQIIQAQKLWHDKDRYFLMLKATVYNEDITHEYLCINKRSMFMKQNYR